MSECICFIPYTKHFIITIDDMNHSDIGFIHCDAQGAENHIFSKAGNLIKKNRPVIFYENNKKYNCYTREG